MSKNNKKKKQNTIIMVAALCAVVLLGTWMVLEKNQEGSSNKKEVTLSEEGDLIIPVTDISTKASFYPVEVEGTELEVLAVKASDGTIRTAFNTCQICYSSGRGYYKQSGDKLICQNCLNAFSTNDIEVSRNGCNPVPISKEDKLVDSKTITIPNKTLTTYKVIFENWKTAY